MAAALCDAPIRSPAPIRVNQGPPQRASRRSAGARKTCWADLLADEEWRAEVEALDAELHRLSLPNDRLRLRFGEALSKLGRRFRDLGFRRLDLYVRERASRPGRWGAESRRMAERLERFEGLREAFRAGEISWSMAELLARSLERVANESPETETDEGRHLAEEETELLAVARGTTVREMRALLRDRLPERESRIERPGGRNPAAGEQEADDDRIRVRRLLPAHQAMTLEMTLRVIQHMSGGSTGDAFEWLLTEAQTSLIPQVPPELDRIAEDIEARFVERARHRAEVLAECDRDEAVAEDEIAWAPSDRAPVEDDDLLFGPLPDDPGALDRVIRELGFRIASAELYRGWTLAQLLALRGWALLGYVSETQYARERLGMSRSDMYRQARLARHCQKLPAIRDAVRAGALGSSHAGLLVRVATPETERAWLERAQRRTVKHLKEEVDAVERVRRYVAGAQDAPMPPTEAEMALVHAVDREVLTGRALRRALGISRSDLDGDVGRSAVGRRKGAARVSVVSRLPGGFRRSDDVRPQIGGGLSDDPWRRRRIGGCRDHHTPCRAINVGTPTPREDLTDVGIAGLDDGFPPDSAHPEGRTSEESATPIQTGLGYGVLLRASSAGLGRCGRFVGKVLPAR